MIPNKQSFQEIPKGFRKILYLNWAVLFLVIAIANFGFLMLYSVADGSLKPWAEPQIIRFAFGFIMILFFGLIHINFWKKISVVTYLFSLFLLILVLYFGTSGGGAPNLKRELRSSSTSGRRLAMPMCVCVRRPRSRGLILCAPLELRTLGFHLVNACIIHAL